MLELPATMGRAKCSQPQFQQNLDYLQRRGASVAFPPQGRSGSFGVGSYSSGVSTYGFTYRFRVLAAPLCHRGQVGNGIAVG